MNDSNLRNPAMAQEYFATRLAFTTGPVEVNRMLAESRDVVVIDLREEADYERGHVPGAFNLPQDRWYTLEGLSENVTNILYCYSQTCHLAARAAWEFSGKGYPVMEMEGGFAAWKDNRLNVER